MRLIKNNKYINYLGEKRAKRPPEN